MDNLLLKKLKQQNLDKLGDNISYPGIQPTAIPEQPYFESPKQEVDPDIQREILNQKAREMSMQHAQKMAQEEALKNSPVAPEIYDENGNLIPPKPARFNKIKQGFR